MGEEMDFVPNQAHVEPNMLIQLRDLRAVLDDEGRDYSEANLEALSSDARYGSAVRYIRQTGADLRDY